MIISSCDALIGLPGSNKQESGTRSEINKAIAKSVPVVLHPYWKDATFQYHSVAFERQPHGSPVRPGQIVRWNPELKGAHVTEFPMQHVVIDEL